MKINLTTKTFEQLVEANNFGYKYVSTYYKPQKSKQGKVNIELWHPNKVTTNQEFLDHCTEIGGRPATFNEALQFALENPGLQKQYPMITYDGKQLCYLHLYSDDGRRRLYVYGNYPGSYWNDYVRFLVVPAPAPAASSRKLGNSEQIKNNVMKKEIGQVCTGCGCLANALTCLRKYGELPKKYAFSISTFHEGICDVCGAETSVTEPRDFFYPDFDLIEEAKFYFNNLETQ